MQYFVTPQRASQFIQQVQSRLQVTPKTYFYNAINNELQGASVKNRKTYTLDTTSKESIRTSFTKIVEYARNMRYLSKSFNIGYADSDTTAVRHKNALGGNHLYLLCNNETFARWFTDILPAVYNVQMANGSKFFINTIGVQDATPASAALKFGEFIMMSPEAYFWNIRNATLGSQYFLYNNSLTFVNHI